MAVFLGLVSSDFVLAICRTHFLASVGAGLVAQAELVLPLGREEAEEQGAVRGQA